MPKTSFNSGEDRFNFMLALSGFLIRHDGHSTVSEVAEHFDIEPQLVIQTLRTLNLASAKFENRPEDLFYDIDLDQLDEGLIQFQSAESAPDVPLLTTRQASALAAGIQQLASIPDFASSDELSELLAILGAGSTAKFSPAIEVKSHASSVNADIIRRAIISKRRVACEYLNQRGELTNRDIDPLKLSFDGEHFYLAGWCHLAQAMRVFRLDRMKKIAVLDESISQAAETLPGFSDQPYVADKSDIEVLVEVEPEAYRLIAEVQAIAEPKAPESAKIRATIRVGHLQNLGRLISRYGGAAKVVSPPEAREAVKNYALEVLGEDIHSDLAGTEE